MITKALKEEIKALAKGGVLRPLEQLAEELKLTIQSPKYETDQGKFLYESGRLNGLKEGIEILINELNQIAKI